MKVMGPPRLLSNNCLLDDPAEPRVLLYLRRSSYLKGRPYHAGTKFKFGLRHCRLANAVRLDDQKLHANLKTPVTDFVYKPLHLGPQRELCQPDTKEPLRRSAPGLITWHNSLSVVRQLFTPDAEECATQKK